MNILWITIESILPANSGGRIGIFKRLEQVSKNNNIYLFYTMDSLDDEKYIPDLEKFCVEAHGFMRKITIDSILSLFVAPYTVASRKNKKMINAIKKCITENNIDLINVDSPHMGLNLLDLNCSIPIVLNQHNVEWKVYENVSMASSSWIKKTIYKIESIRFKLYEESLYKRIKVSMMTFVSTEDQLYFQNKYPSLHTELVPVGADYKGVKYEWGKTTNKILFVGKMSYSPNGEAALWFANKVFPIIKKQIPDAEFWVVGKEPKEEVLSLSLKEGIFITGSVESVDPYYRQSGLVVVPLLHGGGVKVKLLEGLGEGVPIITTPVGAQGTLFDDRYLLIAKDEHEMANQCISFLKERLKYKEFYENTFRLFRERYTWECIGEQYEHLLRSTIKSEVE